MTKPSPAFPPVTIATRPLRSGIEEISQLCLESDSPILTAVDGLWIRNKISSELLSTTQRLRQEDEAKRLSGNPTGTWDLSADKQLCPFGLLFQVLPKPILFGSTILQSNTLCWDQGRKPAHRDMFAALFMFQFSYSLRGFILITEYLSQVAVEPVASRTTVLRDQTTPMIPYDFSFTSFSQRSQNCVPNLRSKSSATSVLGVS